jgi:DNA polymerase-3 subunit gamma/tau
VDAGRVITASSQPQEQSRNQVRDQAMPVSAQERAQSAAAVTPAATVAGARAGSGADSNIDNSAVPASSQAAPGPSPKSVPGQAVSDDWREIVNALGLGGLVKQLAINCTVKKRDGSHIVLQIETGHANLINPKAKQRLQQALGEYFNIEAQLEIEVVNTISGESPAQTVQRETEQRQQQAVRSINEDSFTQTLKENFNAEIIPGSVKPVS